MPVNNIRTRDVRDTKFSNAWKNWLINKKAYSDLADSGIYRNFTNSAFNLPNKPTTGTIFDNLSPHAKTIGVDSALKRIYPGLKYTDVKVDSGDVPQGAAGMLEQHEYGKPVRSTIHINTTGMVQPADKFKHELQHAIIDKADYLYGNRDADFFDRKIGQIYHASDDPADKTFSQRSQDEHLARRAQNGFLATDPPNQYEMQKGHYVPPEDRIVRARPKYMQKGSPVYQLMKAAGMKLPFIGGALAGASFLANPSISQAAEIGAGFTPAAPIAEWLNPRVLNDVDEEVLVKRGYSGRR